MKSLLFSLLLLIAVPGYSQYKHFSIGINGVTNNFDCYEFYSSPTVSAQYNFKKIFSLSLGISKEKMKDSSFTFNDLQFEYNNNHNELTYFNLPLSLRANFGKKVIVYFEAGAMFHLNYKIRNDGSITDPDEPGSTEYFSYEYLPSSAGAILPFAGAGVNIPVYKNLYLNLGAGRSFLKPEEFYDNEVFINNNFRYTNGFVKFKYNVGLVYHFNLRKESEYSFTTHYIQILKDN